MPEFWDYCLLMAVLQILSFTPAGDIRPVYRLHGDLSKADSDTHIDQTTVAFVAGKLTSDVRNTHHCFVRLPELVRGSFSPYRFSGVSSG